MITNYWVFNRCFIFRLKPPISRTIWSVLMLRSSQVNIRLPSRSWHSIQWVLQPRRCLKIDSWCSLQSWTSHLNLTSKCPLKKLLVSGRASVSRDSSSTNWKSTWLQKSTRLLIVTKTSKLLVVLLPVWLSLRNKRVNFSKVLETMSWICNLITLSELWRRHRRQKWIVRHSMIDQVQ